MAVEGLDHLRRQLDGLRRAAAPATMAALRKAADVIVAQQRALAPTRSGKLRASIVASEGSAPKYASLVGVSRSRQAGEFVVISAGNSVVRYAHLVEFGTRRHSLAKGASLDKGLLQDRGPIHPGARRRDFFFAGYRAARSRARGVINKQLRANVLEFTRGADGSYGLA